MWAKLGPKGRVALGGGFAVVLAFIVISGFWLMQSDYEVLFSELSARDAAVMTAELEKTKTPYRLENQGTAISVPKDMVYKTRIALMGKDLPLHGTVGFELFNNSDFGATEFAQRVNYQRALQGEITRTILSIAEVKSARLHLAIPEDTLFKKNVSSAKASVFLSMKEGRQLSGAQVAGIQRLVAAAVPSIQRQDVTIVDEHGVALSRPVEQADGDVTPRLDLKRETENYLERKVQAVLDKALGPGQGIVSVAVSLDMNRVQVTTEDVVAPPGRGGDSPAGVIVHEKLVDRGGAAPDGRAAPIREGVQREVDYQVGRRVEQVISAPGTVRRVQVAAVVRRAMEPEEVERLRSVLMAAAGASGERGDSVVVHAMPQPVAQATAQAPDVADLSAAQAASPVKAEGTDWMPVVALVGGIVALLMAVWLVARALGRRAVRLSAAERTELLGKIEGWLVEPDAALPALGSNGAAREQR